MRAMDPDTSLPPRPTTMVTAINPSPATASHPQTDPPSVLNTSAPSESAPTSTNDLLSLNNEPEPALLFGQKQVPFSQPHHSQDLISQYHVTQTAARVARIDPITGEKINKLRSSYQNHIKIFQIAGRNKPIKHDDSQHGMSLRDIAAWPEEEWHNQKVSSKEVSKGLSNSALSKLDKAVKLEPGPVPKNDEWESILGHEKTKPGASPNEPDVRPAMQERKLSKINGHTNGASPSPADNETVRARRTGKRRRYDDDSFEGYGEGFVDDDRDDGDGFSSDGGTKKKRRRKDLNSLHSPGDIGYNIGVQQPSIGRGIGAYGGR